MSCPRHGAIPHGSYALLIGEFSALSVAVLNHARRGHELSLTDVVLLGTATHKLSRLIAKDRITSVLRAPVTEQHEVEGKLEECPKGTGMRRALGELITCPFCVSPWVASGLLAATSSVPSWSRPLLGMLSALALSDLLHNITRTLTKIRGRA